MGLDYGSMVKCVKAPQWTALPLLLALMATACGKERMIRVAWDAPPVPPQGYRVLVDDRLVMDIPPPALDPSCACQSVTVPVPRGQHVVKVVAYNQSGESAPNTVTVPR